MCENPKFWLTRSASRNFTWLLLQRIMVTIKEGFYYWNFKWKGSVQPVVGCALALKARRLFFLYLQGGEKSFFFLIPTCDSWACLTSKTRPGSTPVLPFLYCALLYKLSLFYPVRKKPVLCFYYTHARADMCPLGNPGCDWLVCSHLTQARTLGARGCVPARNNSTAHLNIHSYNVRNNVADTYTN